MMSDARQPRQLRKDAIREARQLRRWYTLLAPVYDAFARRASSRARCCAINGLALDGTETVVDIGIGTGLSLERLFSTSMPGTEHPHRCIGVDSTPAMLRRARTRASRRGMGDRVALVHGDARRLPLPDDSADAVLSTYVLDTLTADARADVLTEVARVMRPGGRAAFAHLTTPRTPIERAWTWAAERVPLLLGGGRPVDLDLEGAGREGAGPDDAGLTVLWRRREVQFGLASEVLLAQMQPPEQITRT